MNLANLMMFSSQFASWLFYAILAISFNPALLQPNENDEKLYKLVKNFNKELEQLNALPRGKLMKFEGTNEDKMKKFIKEPFSDKMHKFLKAYINMLEQAGSKQESIGQKLELCKGIIREIEVLLSALFSLKGRRKT
jgi:hypothetical protein